MILYLSYKVIKKTVLSINDVPNCLQTPSNNLWLFKIYFKNERRIKKIWKKKKIKKNQKKIFLAIFLAILSRALCSNTRVKHKDNSVHLKPKTEFRFNWKQYRNIYFFLIWAIKFFKNQNRNFFYLIKLKICSF